MEIQSNGLKRTLLIHSAENTHGGTYECSTSDDTITFKVDITGDLCASRLFMSIDFCGVNGTSRLCFDFCT